MDKFIINEGLNLEVEVEAVKYGLNNGFFNFIDNSGTVFTIDASQVTTIRRIG